MYYEKIMDEQDALDRFESVLSSGNIDLIMLTALGLKPGQTQAYLMLGGIGM